MLQQSSQLIFVCVAAIASVVCIPLDGFFPYDFEENNATLDSNEVIRVTQSLKFLGRQMNLLLVSLIMTNGNGLGSRFLKLATTLIFTTA